MVRTGKGKKRRSGVLLLVILFSLSPAWLALPRDAEGGVTAAWERRYNGSGNSYATAMVVDGQGNAYVTGRSYNSTTGWDYATIKYNPDGVQLWEQRYHGTTGKDFDEARAIALDNQGNVFVTGYSTGAGTGADFATIKYSSYGVQLWARRMDQSKWDNFATALAVDGQGNVYVTGPSEGYGTGWDFLTIKYDNTGTRLWSRRYNRAGNRHDSPRAMAVDTQGNVYVTGESWVSGNGYDYTTIKYDTNGTVQWTKTSNGAGDGHDYPSAIAVDSHDPLNLSVYVTGSQTGVGTSSDFATIKYKADVGTTLWTRRITRTGSDFGKAVAVDGQGNVYVTGLSYSAGAGAGYFTVKYDTAGVLKWGHRFDGPADSWDEATAIAVDGDGNVYVAGSLDSDFATIKYNTTGDWVWTMSYPGPGNGGGAGAMALYGQVDPTVYVAGFSARAATGWDWDYVTIKYLQTP